MKITNKVSERYKDIGCLAIVFLGLYAIGGWQGFLEVGVTVALFLLTFFAIPFLYRYLFETKLSDKSPSKRILHYILKPIAFFIFIILIIVCGYFLLRWFAAKQGAIMGY